MNYYEGPGHLWEAICTKCNYKEAGTFSPAIEPYQGKYYSVYLEPTTTINKEQILLIKEYLNCTHNLVQIKNKFSYGKSHEILSLLHDNIVEPIVKRFNDVGLKVKVVEKDEP